MIGQGPHASPAQKLNSFVIVCAVRDVLRDGKSVTMRGTAQALGVSAPALYRHVENLEDLLRLVVSSIDEDLVRIVNASAEGSGARHASGNLAEAVRRIRLWALANPREFDLLLHSNRSGTGGPALADLATVRLLFKLGPHVSAPAWSRLFGALVLEVLGHVDSCGLADGSLFAIAVDGLGDPSARRLGTNLSKLHSNEGDAWALSHSRSGAAEQDCSTLSPQRLHEEADSCPDAH